MGFNLQFSHTQCSGGKAGHAALAWSVYYIDNKSSADYRWYGLDIYENDRKKIFVVMDRGLLDFNIDNFSCCVSFPSRNFPSYKLKSSRDKKFGFLIAYIRVLEN